MSTFLAILSSLPLLIKYLDRLDRLVKQGRLDGWIKEAEDVFAKLDKAQTPRERLDAAKRINDLADKLRK